MTENPLKLLASLAFAAMLLVAAVLLTDYLLTGKTPRQWFGPTPNELMEIGQPTVDAILKFKEEHGVYPRSLNDAGLVAPETVYGPFQYRVFEMGQRFELSVGDFLRDGFTLMHSSVDGWRVDS